jgi:hypothetical protein
MPRSAVEQETIGRSQETAWVRVSRRYGLLRSRTWQAAEGSNRTTVELVADRLPGNRFPACLDEGGVADRRAGRSSWWWVRKTSIARGWLPLLESWQVRW